MSRLRTRPPAVTAQHVALDFLIVFAPTGLNGRVQKCRRRDLTLMIVRRETHGRVNFSCSLAEIFPDDSRGMQ
jgi:hypothetical protein